VTPKVLLSTSRFRFQLRFQLKFRRKRARATLFSVMKGAGMARWLRLLAATSVACLIGTMVYAEDLKVGDKAPDFKLQGTDGKTYSLADLKGKTVVLAWFPKAFTGG
jgi:hypothetical protein